MEVEQWGLGRPKIIHMDRSTTMLPSSSRSSMISSMRKLSPTAQLPICSSKSVEYGCSIIVVLVGKICVKYNGEVVALCETGTAADANDKLFTMGAELPEPKAKLWPFIIVSLKKKNKLFQFYFPTLQYYFFTLIYNFLCFYFSLFRLQTRC